MAKITLNTTIYFNSCKECPYCHKGYTGVDGFGRDYTYDADYCDKGYFGKTIGTDSNGRVLYDSSIKAPNCIPLYCEFSEKETPKIIEDLLTLSDEEILNYIQYLRNPKQVNKNEFYTIPEISDTVLNDFEQEKQKHIEQAQKIIREQYPDAKILDDKEEYKITHKDLEILELLEVPKEILMKFRRQDVQ